MSAVPKKLTRPALTLPQREAAHLSACYAEAGVILEYGLGGSTVLAAEMPGKTITSIETDESWIDTLNCWFDSNPAQSQPDIIWANIGPTGHWGRPTSEKNWRDFSRYPLEIWALEDVPHPDVVFVDGRFRAGCVLATAFHCKQTTRVLVDDYARRPSYHMVESIVGPPANLIGRMAEFHLTPTPIKAKDLLSIITALQDPY